MNVREAQLRGRSQELTRPEASPQSVAPQETGETESHRWSLAFFALASVLVVLFLALALRPLFLPLAGSGDHYVYLAESFVRGELSVDSLPDSYTDVVSWQGHKYLPFGLLPALILIPFLPLLQFGMPLVTVAHLFTLANVWLFAVVLSRLGITGVRQKWSLLLFFGGTVYFSCTLDLTSGNSWLLAHIITTTFLLLALVEVLGKRRPVLVGLYLGLAGLTRFTALFALPFFVWMLWRGRRPTEEAPQPPLLSGPSLRALFRPAVLLGVGVAGPVAAILAYNYLRFGSPLENGYALAFLRYDVLNQARDQGLFGLVHVPKNLFMLLVQGPLPYPSVNAPVLEFPYVVPSPWGMGLFFTTPAFIYIFRARLREPLVLASWLAVLCVMLPIITYYGVGWVQFGYRYGLDFTPFLLLLAARGFPEPLPNRVRALIVASVLINLWGSFLIALAIVGTT